jgi:acyl-CoA thioesterase I
VARAIRNLLRAKGYNVHVKNAGIPGDTTSHMLKRVDSAMPDGTKIVILDMGGDIFNRAKPTFRAHRDKLI